MTANPALDAAIRKAQHLLFAFNGPIRNASAENPAGAAAPIAPHIHEALTACRESGRSVVVISAKPQIDVSAYLDAHDLFTQITVIAASVTDAINALDATPDGCLLVTSSPADIQAAQAAGVPSIGYSRTPDDAGHLADAGATTFVYSMADLALSLRVHRLNL